ncbi:MAG: selenocysteine-specific translation elongation factor [Alphaproteobacteria bacterium]|nr:selenocysteine-specific translation elongation factor [Alphaproteobacteria bacterium]
MIVGTAGHIDHGKTTLVRALTGVDTDRLPEEKARGITIDLGFAYLPLANGRTLGFVDVPGHERFIHNMLAGVGGIDFALLVVAADDGPMPQTREHLAILDLLGVTRGVVAITKADLADAERLDFLEGEIRALLAGTTLQDADIVPVSAQSGMGIDDLKARLDLEAEATGDRVADGWFRMPIDRCFTVAGAGTVVTGTVFSGEVRQDEQLALLSTGAAARVRGIHAQNTASKTGRAGQRCALNIAGPQVSKDAIHRGDWLVAPELRRPTDRLDVRLRLLPEEPRPLRHWTPVHLHLGAAHVMGRVVLLDAETLAPGMSALAQLVLDRPVGALHGDRLILRDQSARRTMAGGVVLDPWPPNRFRRRPERLALLAALQETDPAQALAALAALPPQIVDLAAFALARNLRPAARDAAVAAAGLRALPATDGSGGSFALTATRLAEIEAAVVATLGAHHQKQPNSAGLEPERLRVALPMKIVAAPFGAIVAALLSARVIEADGPWLRLPGHAVRLSPEDEKLWARIRPTLEQQRFGPPRVRDFADDCEVPETKVRELLRRLSKMGVVWQVAPDHFFLRGPVVEMARIAADLAARAPDSRFKAAEFRDRIGGGRKVAIQILEFFDRGGVTTLRDQVRVVNKDRYERFVKGAGPS